MTYSGFALDVAGNAQGAMMIGYVTLGTNDLAAGAPLYDAIAAKMGTGRVMKTKQYIASATPGGGPPGIGLTLPYDGHAATAGNGTIDDINRPGSCAGRPAVCLGLSPW